LGCGPDGGWAGRCERGPRDAGHAPLAEALLGHLARRSRAETFKDFASAQPRRWFVPGEPFEGKSPQNFCARLAGVFGRAQQGAPRRNGLGVCICGPGMDPRAAEAMVADGSRLAARRSRVANRPARTVALHAMIFAPVAGHRAAASMPFDAAQAARKSARRSQPRAQRALAIVATPRGSGALRLLGARREKRPMSARRSRERQNM